MLGCDDVMEKLSLYIDEALERDEMAEIAAHLSSCEQCRQEYEALKSVLVMVQEIPSVDLPEGFHEEVMAGLPKGRLGKRNLRQFKKQNSERKPFLQLVSGGDFRRYVPVAAGVLGTFIIMSSLVTAANQGLNSIMSRNAAGVMPMSAPESFGYDDMGEMEENFLEESVSEEFKMPEAADFAMDMSDSAYFAAEDASAGSPEMLRGIPEAAGELEGEGKEDAPANDREDEISLITENLPEGGRVQAFSGPTGQENGSGKIREYHITIETEDVPLLVEWINQMQGFTEQSWISSTSAQLTKRVAEGREETFINEIKGLSLGTVISESAYEQDIVQYKVDNRSRLNARSLEQQRLIGLMDTAGSIEDLLSIEDRIRALEYEAGRYQANLRSYANKEQSPYVFINIVRRNVDEPVAERNFGQRIAGSFVFSVNMTSAVMEDILIFFAGATVPVIFFSIVGFIVFKTSKKIAGKKQDRLG